MSPVPAAIVDVAAQPPEFTRRCRADLPDRIEGDPRHVTELRFEGPDGHPIACIWSSAPHPWHALRGRGEICSMVWGHARLIDTASQARTSRAGDTFLIPDGFRGIWEVLETTTKHFVNRLHIATPEDRA